MHDQTTEDWGYDEVVVAEDEDEDTDDEVEIMHYLVRFNLERSHNFINFAANRGSTRNELYC